MKKAPYYISITNLSTTMSSNSSNGGCGVGHGNNGQGRQAKCGGNCSQGNTNHQKLHTQQVRFQGACDALKGHIFDCSDQHQADCYAMLLKKLTKHVSLMYKNGGDIHASIVTETKYTVPQPAALTPPVDPNQLTASKQVAQKMFDK